VGSTQRSRHEGNNLTANVSLLSRQCGILLYLYYPLQLTSVNRRPLLHGGHCGVGYRQLSTPRQSSSSSVIEDDRPFGIFRQRITSVLPNWPHRFLSHRSTSRHLMVMFQLQVPSPVCTRAHVAILVERLVSGDMSQPHETPIHLSTCRKRGHCSRVLLSLLCI
jgi:hypothetical protein